MASAQHGSDMGVTEQVRSAEFAMSSFSVLNNQEVGPDQTLSPTSGSNAQKQHILSGTLQLKQSNSVSNGHEANETMSQQEGTVNEPLQAVEATKSKTVMEYQNEDARPNRPLEQHFDAINVAQEPKILGAKPVTEQVVYNRLPKDYFMEAAEEQMDIDIAINDIKKLR